MKKRQSRIRGKPAIETAEKRKTAERRAPASQFSTEEP